MTQVLNIDLNLFSRMELCIKVNGKKLIDMDMEYKSGLTVPSMKVTGRIIKLMD